MADLNEWVEGTDFKEFVDHFGYRPSLSVYGCDRIEDTHSDFFAWLLDPAENHNLGNQPLIQFLLALKKLSQENEGAHEKLTKLNEGRLILSNEFLDSLKGPDTSISNVDVKREFQDAWNGNVRNSVRPDILLTAEINQTEFVLILENKIYSTEGEDQTVDYFDWAKNKYPEATILCVYANPYLNKKLMDLSKNPFSSNDFVFITYQFLLDNWLKEFGESNHKNVQIDDYIRSLKNRSLTNRSKNRKNVALAISQLDRDVCKKFMEKSKEQLLRIKDALRSGDTEIPSLVHKIMPILQEIIPNTDLEKDGFSVIEVRKGTDPWSEKNIAAGHLAEGVATELNALETVNRDVSFVGGATYRYIIPAGDPLLGSGIIKWGFRNVGAQIGFWISPRFQVEGSKAYRGNFEEVFSVLENLTREINEKHNQTYICKERPFAEKVNQQEHPSIFVYSTIKRDDASAGIVSSELIKMAEYYVPEMIRSIATEGQSKTLFDPFLKAI